MRYNLQVTSLKIPLKGATGRMQLRRQEGSPADEEDLTSRLIDVLHDFKELKKNKPDKSKKGAAGGGKQRRLGSIKFPNNMRRKIDDASELENSLADRLIDVLYDYKNSVSKKPSGGKDSDKKGGKAGKKGRRKITIKKKIPEKFRTMYNKLPKPLVRLTGYRIAANESGDSVDAMNVSSANGTGGPEGKANGTDAGKPDSGVEVSEGGGTRKGDYAIGGKRSKDAKPGGKASPAKGGKDKSDKPLDGAKVKPGKPRENLSEGGDDSTEDSASSNEEDSGSSSEGSSELKDMDSEEGEEEPPLDTTVTDSSGGEEDE